MSYVGVDVSKGKWLTVKLAKDEPCEVSLFDTIRDIWDSYEASKLILIDIPIGLREKGNEERQCDKEARRLLGWPRRSSVFRVPCRATLEAANYDAAKEINKDMTGGKSLPIQSWSIIPKIKEVDGFLYENISARSRIKEIHPEVCFWALNDGKPMTSNKKTPDGFHERIKVLRRVCNQTDTVIQIAKSKFQGKIADDDILDALVAVVTALVGERKVLTLPEKPEIDVRGLPMEMIYYRIKPEQEGKNGELL